MIRPATTADLGALRAVAKGTAMFLGEELDHFIEMAATHLDAPDTPLHALLVATANGRPDSAVQGAAFFGPEAMAQGVMTLFFIGVLPAARGRGHGRALMRAFEDAARAAAMRLMIIETASDAMFAPAWALYRAEGFEEEARIRDFYDDGLDKLVYRKRVSG